MALNYSEKLQKHQTTFSQVHQAKQYLAVSPLTFQVFNKNIVVVFLFWGVRVNYEQVILGGGEMG